ncbi:MAG: hypothetical protein HYZ81_26465 [Nitrospinae bacterium]|nr:hypothetical protein [Nitrospinota bacterium]
MDEKNAFVSVSREGFAASFWRALQRAVRERGGTDQDLYRIGTQEGEWLIGQFADLIVQSEWATRNVFRVTVNHRLSVEAMVLAGRYNRSLPMETMVLVGAALAGVYDFLSLKNFTVSPEGKTEVDIELVHFGQMMVTGDVLRKLDQKGLRPATLRELLAFGAQYPAVQRVFPIVALGSSWVEGINTRTVAYLWGNPAERGIGRRWFVSKWRDVYRFAAART